MKTELIIMSSGTTYVSSGTIDLYDDVPISLNYNIADIKEPQSRNADYSKTITIPGTNNNHHLFSNIYEIGIDRLFNPNKKVEARILVDKIQVFKGFLRMMKIRTLRDNKIEYDLEMKGRTDDLFTIIKDKKLTDMVWTDLDHTYNKTNIKNSWSAAVGSNYIYPFLDFGSSSIPNVFSVADFRPATYVKEIWDRIMRFAGFQYTSTFLTSSFLKRLIIPFASEKFQLTVAQINLRKFRTSKETSTQSIGVTASLPFGFNDIIFNDDSTSPNEDTGSNYNTTTGIWTCPANGVYSFTANVPISKISSTRAIGTVIRLFDVTNSTFIAVSATQTLGTTSNLSITHSFSSSPIFIASGIQLKVQLGSFLSSGSGPGTVIIAIASYWFNQIMPDIVIDNDIVYSSVLPQKMKMSEFLLGIIKMFNLYIEYDKDTPNKLLIEPRNDFYNSTVQDWSNKLDVSKEPEIMPMGALDAKRYIFRYKKDNDWLNTLYQDKYGQGTDSTYGERIKDVDNDFLKNDNVIESIFSATPLYSDTTSDRVYPVIQKIDPQTQAVSPISANVRILYYSGLKSSTPSWTFYDYNIINPTIETQYPYCGHLDDAASPSLDLNFGIPKEIYYVPAFNATYTNANLYNVYWRQFIEEIIDYNSSLVTAWFWLKPADILEINFQNIYRFKNQNFRLNKIYDYNPITYQQTKCEFIKVRITNTFTNKTATLTGGRNASIKSP